ncbi:MAG TPA: family 43 glycosylhydrolase [Verrucomicrobiae bacterium]
MLACILPLILITVSCSRRPKTENIIIDNLSPRCDLNGQIIDAHGGCLQYFNGNFYLYGSRFGTNQDPTVPCPFSVYSSPNLRDWTDQGDLLQDAPKGVYYRPYVVFNPKTKKYVLWYNWYKTLWNGNAGVAVSDSPTGPFVIVNQRARLSGSCPGDGSLFVDDDGTGYYIYTDIDNDYAVRVERLTADFTDSTGKGSGYVGFGNEAPLLFRRNDLYYVLVASLCAACPQGSEVAVETSPSPLGPFTFAREINHQSGHDPVQASSETAIEADDAGATNGGEHPTGFVRERGKKNPFIHGQETWVAQIPTAGGNPMYIWMADGWFSAKDKELGHDFQYWSAPLQFNTNGDGSIQPLKFTPRWMLVLKPKSN